MTSLPIHISALDASCLYEEITSPSISPRVMHGDAQEPKISSRAAALRELLESEKKYIEFLNIIWSVYYEPLLNPHAEQRACLIPLEVAHKLLPSEFNTIRTLNNNLLKTLVGRLEPLDDNKIATASVGDVFMKLAPFFKNYVSYNTSFGNCVDSISKLRKTNSGLCV